MKAELGDTVTVVYDGITENGEIFDSSESSGPLELVLGAGNVLPGFEENIIGLSTGESKEFKLSPREAHGLSNPELIHTFNKQGIKDHAKIKVGMVLGLNLDRDGQQQRVPATVIAVDETQITVDFNHPMAGLTLTYKVTVQSVAKQQAN
nr:peptidylprolyl isomerase [Desulfobulbaceae bacterium]